MAKRWAVMVASSDLGNRQRVAEVVSQQGIDMFSVSTVAECRETLDTRSIGLVFCDSHFPDGDYRDIMAASCAVRKAPRVVLMVPLMKSVEYDQAKRCGVYDIILSPCRPTDVEWMVIATRQRELIQLEQPGPSGGVSPA
jgi:DNA-binding NtrC family response regulator